jgi:hypothetical protein
LPIAPRLARGWSVRGADGSVTVLIQSVWLALRDGSAIPQVLDPREERRPPSPLASHSRHCRLALTPSRRSYSLAAITTTASLPVDRRCGSFVSARRTSSRNRCCAFFSFQVCIGLLP